MIETKPPYLVSNIVCNFSVFNSIRIPELCFWGGGRGLWLQFLCFVKGKMILANYYHCYYVLFAYMDVWCVQSQNDGHQKTVLNTGA